MAIAIGLLKMLLELQQTRKTGALDVAGPAARVRLFVEDGSVVLADEGTVGETLGRILLRERVLTQEQYGAAIEWMADLRTAGKRAMLGEVFVDLGFLTAEQVYAALAAQVQQKVMRALGWASARFTFIESNGPLVIGGRFPTQIEPLVVSALRLAEREDIVDLLAQANHRFVALRGDHVPGGGSARLETIARINAFRLPAAEDEFARTLDGSRTVAELLADDPAGADRGVVMAALLLTDVLDLHGAAIAPRPETDASAKPRPPKPPSLPKPKAATPAKPERPRSIRPSPPEERAHVKKVAEHMRSAQEAKRMVPTPSEVDLPNIDTPRAPTTPARLAPLLAEKAYQAGKRLVRAHRVAEAVLELRKAASLYPAAEYDLWAAWAEARSDARGDAAHADKLRAAADLAIAQDTERGFATFVLAYLAHRAGDLARAEELFVRARELDPEAAVDAWDVRLRVGPSTGLAPRSEVRSLAPLLTSPSSRPPSALALFPAPALAPAPAPAPAPPEAQQPPDPPPSPASDPLERASSSPPPPSSARAIPPAPDSSAGDRASAGLPLASSSAMRTIVLGAIAVTAVAIAGYVMTRPPPSQIPVSPVSVQAPPSASASASASPMASATTMETTPSPVSAPASGEVPPSAHQPDLAPSTSRDQGAPSDASYAASDATLPSVDGAKGILDLPPAADGHRVYVDGHMVGVPPPPITVQCGRHIVKIGSQGRDQTIVVPCGGSASVAYP